MRQLMVQVPRGEGERALEAARRLEATNISLVPARSEEGPTDLVFLSLSNRRIEAFLEEVGGIRSLQVTYVPQGALVLRPPAPEAAQQVIDVEARSPLEILLGGLQSVGSWGSFLAYALLAGVVVWIGLFTNTAFLLVAAMLIAPFAGPAMNVALGSARGDPELIRRGAARYFASLGVTAGACFLLSLVMGQQIATEQMIERSHLPSVAVLLALAAGAAGALNVSQSERHSLVSGAAAGMLVAASLAPPAGLVGMAAAIGRADLLLSGVFQLLLQLAAINLAGTLVFRRYGVSAEGSRYARGAPRVFPWAVASSAVAVCFLLVIQFWNPPSLQHATRAQRAAAEIHQVVRDFGLADLVEVNARFTRPDLEGQNTLLAVVYVQRRPGAPVTPEQLRSDLARRCQEHLLARGFRVTPLVDVVVLEPPPPPAP